MIINLRRWWHKSRLWCSLFSLMVLGGACIQIAEIADTGPVAIAGTKTEQKVVALTFDHSWGNKYTPAILDTLKKNDTRVTFFIMGPWAVKYSEVVKQMVADGHELGSHGHRHQNYGEKSAQWVRDDLLAAHEEIKRASGGTEARLLRPPNGSYSKESLRVVEELGYKNIIWNIDSLDWKNPGAEVMVNRIMKRLKPGGIILMHASDTPKHTAETLPVILEKIKSQGYRIVTVGELLTQYAEGGVVRH